MNKKQCLLFLLIPFSFRTLHGGDGKKTIKQEASSKISSALALLNVLIPEVPTPILFEPLKISNEKQLAENRGYLESFVHSTSKAISNSYYVRNYTSCTQLARTNLVLKHIKRGTSFDTKLGDNKTLGELYQEMNYSRTSITNYIVTLSHETVYSDAAQDQVIKQEAAKSMIDLVMVNRQIIPFETLLIARNALKRYIESNANEGKKLFTDDITIALAGTSTTHPHSQNDSSSASRSFSGSGSSDSNSNNGESSCLTISNPPNTPPINIPSENTPRGGRKERKKCIMKDSGNDFIVGSAPQNLSPENSSVPILGQTPPTSPLSPLHSGE